MNWNCQPLGPNVNSHMERLHPPEPGGLEASLLQMINDHNTASLKLREQTEKSKKEAIRTAMRVSDLLVNAVNGNVQEVFIIEKRIEMEIRALAAAVARFSKQTDQWLTASHTINTAVKDRQTRRGATNVISFWTHNPPF
ncbi:biogenesis of lysosome-related organelles complex 1 subunit 1 isoform X2 [Henckelia pumila]|uniref:biogenesis of lysosome-related organelles complex 1 subunit 1 isoform X2 n=1 Tax=Henckelia pumila TaxID=405737 RepID=UPI003C6E20C2